MCAYFFPPASSSIGALSWRVSRGGCHEDVRGKGVLHSPAGPIFLEHKKHCFPSKSISTNELHSSADWQGECRSTKSALESTPSKETNLINIRCIPSILELPSFGICVRALMNPRTGRMKGHLLAAPIATTGSARTGVSHK